MRHLLLFITLTLPSLLLAQQESKLSKKNSINISGGVAFGYRLEGADFKLLKERLTKEYIPMVDMNPILAGNYRFGIDYQRQLVQNLSVKIGARLANWNLTYEPPSVISKENKYTYWFVEVPVILNYKFGTKKLQPYVELGASPSFQVFQAAQHGFFNNSFFTVTIHAGLGLSYQISKSFSLFGQISSRFQTESIITDYRYDDLLFLYEIGLELGAAFHF